ncbi:MAG: histidine kinase [Actinomycetota bacterium]|nr:histidine kinase [Actinomycetota bacterium]
MSTVEPTPTSVGRSAGGSVNEEPAGRPWRWARSRALDPALVAALTVLAVASLPVTDLMTTVDRDTDAVAVVLVLLAGGATAVRGRWPIAAAVAVGVLVGVYLAVGYPYGPLFGFVVLAVYAVARHRPLERSAAVAVAVYLLLVGHVWTNAAALAGLAGLLPVLAWVAIPFTVGAARRLVVAAQARERRASDRRLVDAERLRLSQEVHDVVGHGLAAIQMQADITLHLSQPRPEQSRAALEAISHASSTALDELRSTLAAIRSDRDDRDDRDDAAASTAPTPGLARAAELCRRVEDAGVAVRLDIEGDPRPLPAAADVAAYRVLQEALTNVIKHSAHQHADVRIVHTAAAVTIEVTNQNLGPPPVDGIGITGMRRRVTRLGGTFRAGPGPHGSSFQVRAALPRTPEAAL